MARIERRFRSEQTKSALEMRRRNGVVLGAPRLLPAEVSDRIVAEHASGKMWTAIARGLNDDGIPTAQGGAKWYPSSVQHVVRSRNARADGELIPKWSGRTAPPLA